MLSGKNGIKLTCPTLPSPLHPPLSPLPIPAPHPQAMHLDLSGQFRDEETVDVEGASHTNQPPTSSPVLSHPSLFPAGHASRPEWAAMHLDLSGQFRDEETVDVEGASHTNQPPTSSPVLSHPSLFPAGHASRPEWAAMHLDLSGQFRDEETVDVEGASHTNQPPTSSPVLSHPSLFPAGHASRPEWAAMHLDLSGQFRDEETVDVEGASHTNQPPTSSPVLSHPSLFPAGHASRPEWAVQRRGDSGCGGTDASSADAYTNDLDFDLFLSFDHYREKPSPYTEPIDPFYLNGDRTFCTCLLFFRPTVAAKSLVGNWAFRLAKLGRQGGMDQTQFNLVMQWMYQRKVLPRIGVLPPLQFPSGQLMAQHWEEFEEVRPRVVMVHANYLTGKEVKIKGLNRAGLWRVKEKVQGAEGQAYATAAGSASSGMVARLADRDEGGRMVGVGIEEGSTGSGKEGKEQTRVGKAGGRGGEGGGGWEARSAVGGDWEARVLAAVEPWVGEHLGKMEEAAMGVAISAGLVIVTVACDGQQFSIHYWHTHMGCTQRNPSFPCRPLLATIAIPSPTPAIHWPGVVISQLPHPQKAHPSFPCRPHDASLVIPSPMLATPPSPPIRRPGVVSQESLFRNWLNHITRIPSLGSAILASVPPQMRTPGGHVITRSNESVSPRVARATCLLLPPLILARLLAANVTVVFSTRKAEAPAIQGAEGAAEKGLGNSTEQQVGEGGGSTQQAEAPAMQGGEGAAEKGLENGMEQMGEGGGSTQQAEAPALQGAQGEAGKGLGNSTEKVGEGGGSTQQGEAPTLHGAHGAAEKGAGKQHRAAGGRGALRGYQIAEAATEGGSGVFSGSEVLKRALNNAVAEMVRKSKFVGVEEDRLGRGSTGGLDAGTGAGTSPGQGASVGMLPEQLFPPGWRAVGDRAWLEAHRNEMVALQVSCGEDGRQQEVCLRDMNLWL
ncbi:unnamed protein product [Closterium sp. Naga37s-1]|nr:unnamed protein product [Closterium sp. Naga37s-1]